MQEKGTVSCGVQRNCCGGKDFQERVELPSLEPVGRPLGEPRLPLMDFPFLGEAVKGNKGLLLTRVAECAIIRTVIKVCSAAIVKEA